MISSDKPVQNSRHAKEYFKIAFSKGDYYLNKKSSGLWKGKAAEKLNLPEEVTKKDFYHLIDNEKPDGSRLTARNSIGRRCGMDFTFSPPKSVSIAIELGEYKRLESAYDKAVDSTMQMMEEDTTIRDRNKKAGHNTGNFVYAEFKHRTTRPLDDGKPDLQTHTHCFIINSSYDERKDKWNAIDFGVFKRKENVAERYQEHFHQTLKQEIEKEGFRTYPTKNAFEIDGISREMIEKFSRREAKIEKDAEKLDLSEKGKATLGAKNRNPKNEELSPEELKKYWYDKLSDDEKESLKNLMESEDEKLKRQHQQAALIEKSKENQKINNIQNQPEKQESEKKQEPKNIAKADKKTNNKSQSKGTLTLERTKGEIQAGQIIYGKNDLDSSKPMNGGFTVKSFDEKQGTVTIASNFNQKEQVISKEEVACYERYDKQHTEFNQGDIVQITQSGKGKRQIGDVRKGEVFEVLKPPENGEGMHLQSRIDSRKDKIILDENYGYVKKITDAKEAPKQITQAENKIEKIIAQEKEKHQQPNKSQNKSFVEKEQARKLQREQSQKIVQQQKQQTQQKQIQQQRAVNTAKPQSKGFQR